MKRSELVQLHEELRQDTLAMLDIIWVLAEDQGLSNFADLARESGLCQATLYRYWGGAFKRPQLLTLQKLCRVVGLTVTITSQGLETSLNELKDEKRGWVRNPSR